MPPFGSTTTVRDRTAEFTAIAARLQQQQGAASTSGAGLENGHARPAAGSGANSQHSEFAKRASKIGLGIHATSQKLQKLAQLAKRTSMFDDPAQEINELTAILKQDIQALNVAIADLQNISAYAQQSNKQSVNHSNTVVDNLRTRLKDTTKEFKDVLTLRTENLKLHQGRRQLFSATPDSSSAAANREGGGAAAPRQSSARVPPPLFGNYKVFVAGCPETAPLKTVHPQQTSFAVLQGNLQSSGSSSREDGGASSSEQQPLLGSGQQQQMLLAAPQDTYLDSRAEALQNVERTIVELGGIFTQLADMVQQQGEMTIRIDENVDQALANVDSAQTQLLRYMNSISSNRWLIMKVFFVLMLFVVFFVTFIA